MIVNKNPGFRELHLAGRNEFHFLAFSEYFFSFLAAGFWVKNLAFARKMMALPDSGEEAAATQSSGLYTYSLQSFWASLHGTTDQNSWYQDGTLGCTLPTYVNPVLHELFHDFSVKVHSTGRLIHAV